METNVENTIIAASVVARHGVPKRSETFIFRGKALLLQMRRALTNACVTRPQKFPGIAVRADDARLMASVTARLWKDVPANERRLQAGKIHNLRIAARRIHNLEIPAGALFSFWRHLGYPGKRRGFVEGRELREGCIVPAVAGGLCQLSNLIYQAALEAGCEIVERHGHSRMLPGSAAEAGRDATVFWNYVDLRLRHTRSWRIEAALTAEHLTLNLYEHSVSRQPQEESATEPFTSPTDEKRINFLAKQSASVNGSAERSLPTPATVQSCESCAQDACFRKASQPTSADAHFGRTAYLIDEYWTEFDEFIQSERKAADIFCVPLDGRRYRRGNYAWTLCGFDQIQQSRRLTLQRAWQSRRLAAQGAARQKYLLTANARLAASYVAALKYDVTHLVVAQDLLTALWRAGHLGGRTFDVLMTRLPIGELQARLDRAARLHPVSKTLGDFRADEREAESEHAALAAARRVITPHSAVARLFPHQAVLLDWKLPLIANEKRERKGNRIVFPASTIGRKGAFELRAALRELNLPLTICGGQFEGTNFWDGVRVEQKTFGDELLAESGLLILPAHIEHKPRRLLQAIAVGVPVIATSACGLEKLQNAKVIIVPEGDVAALRQAIELNLP